MLGSPFIELQSIDSTNNYALASLREGMAQHGTAWFAHEQVQGKGQRGKTWSAEKDSSLILSIAIQPQNFLVTEHFFISACAAVAACDLFTELAGEESRIKWPNDLYWHDRKAGGILIENIIRAGADEQAMTLQPGAAIAPGSNWQWSVIGTGININQESFPPEISNAVSLRQITGKKFNTVTLAHRLCECLERRFEQMKDDGFAPIHAQYLQYLYKRGETVKLKRGSRSFEAVIRSVNARGQLVIEHGVEEAIDWGEVSWIIGN